ncbi:unnamed protein product [Ceratitis capitata]|uniref:(Mediterranean fruit fly) hypothetical protein n=1 Tax=Ceratitis capitata TaxID=7213 RepID=A0A811US52_CERCA|nr:unnamed protein product [Ceratitis capitata]
MSTPRLELQAVVLASRLFELIKGFLELVVYTTKHVFRAMPYSSVCVMRIVNPLQKQSNRIVNTSTILSETEIEACKLVHRDCYASEIHNLSSAWNLSKQSSLYKLSPHIDQSGISSQASDKQNIQYQF